MSSRVEIKIDLRNVAPMFADNISAAIAGETKRLAKSFVAVSTEETRPGGPHGVLRNTIQSIKTGRAKHIVVSETEYAAAQEWGRPDLKSYTYTPYMGPAAEKVTDLTTLVPLVKDAIHGAIEKARRRGR